MPFESMRELLECAEDIGDDCDGVLEKREKIRESARNIMEQVEDLLDGLENPEEVHHYKATVLYAMQDFEKAVRGYANAVDRFVETGYEVDEDLAAAKEQEEAT